MNVEIFPEYEVNNKRIIINNKYYALPEHLRLFLLLRAPQFLQESKRMSSDNSRACGTEF